VIVASYFLAGLGGSCIGTYIGFRIASREWDRRRRYERQRFVSPRSLSPIPKEDTSWKEVS
jgi:hypothetical protein